MSKITFSIEQVDLWSNDVRIAIAVMRHSVMCCSFSFSLTYEEYETFKKLGIYAFFPTLEEEFELLTDDDFINRKVEVAVDDGSDALDTVSFNFKPFSHVTEKK